MTSVPAHGPIAAALATHAAASARAFEERAQTVGASEIGRCARQVFYAKSEGDSDFGAPRNPDYVDGWGAKTRGTVFEKHFWVPALRARYGDRLLFAGSAQETFVKGFLSGTPDGLITAFERDGLAHLGVPDIGGDGSLLLECKTVDPRIKIDGPKPEHAYQVQVGLGLIHESTSHRPECGLISYVDASHWDEVYEFPIKRDPKIFENAQRRALRILTAACPEALPPEGWIAGGKECARCPFSNACFAAEARVPSAANKPSRALVADVVALAREAKRREAALDAATAALREVQHAIKENMRAEGVRRVAAAGVSVIWSAIKGRPAYDMPAIRAAAAAAGIDLAEFETTGAPTDRLVIIVSIIPTRDLSEERKTNRDSEKERGIDHVKE